MELILVLLIVAVGFFGQAVFGFGGGLFCIPLLSLLIGVKDAVTLVLILQLLIGVLVFYSYHLVDWKAVRPVLLLLLGGTVLGVASIKFIDDRTLNLLLAAFIFLYLLKEMFFKEVSLARGNVSRLGKVCGFIAGWINGAIGTGGPPIVIYLNELGIDKEQFRASILLFLVSSNVTRIVLSSALGLVTDEVLTFALYAAPVTLFAILCGQRLHATVPQRVYNAVVYSILFASATTLTLKFASDSLASGS